MFDENEPPLWVFLDTEVYRAASFDWSHPSFTSLKMRVSRGSIHLVTTDVVLRELHRLIRGHLNELDQHVQKAAKHAAAVRPVEDKRVDALLDLAHNRHRHETIIEIADRFIADLGTETIEIPTTAVADLFTLYFSGDPPFGSKHKKSEFPDAANMLALLAHARANKTAIHVVSADEDWRRTCERHPELVYFQRISEVLDKAIRTEWLSKELRPDDELLWLLRTKKETLRSLLAQNLRGHSSVNFRDGDLDDLEIEDLHLEAISIIDAWQHEDLINIQAELVHTVHYAAMASIYDEEFDNTLEAELAGEDSLVATVDVNILRDGSIEVLGVEYEHGLSLHIPLKY